MLKIDQELKDLIPPLTKDEYSILEQSIMEEGVLVPIITTMDETIIDGHNRYEIAINQGFDEDAIPHVKKYFESKEEIKLWMIDNQRGRRNLSKTDWLDLGMKRASLLEAKANLARLEGNANGGKSFQKSEMTKPDSEKINTTKEIADFAGVSIDTASKYKKIMSDAPEEIKEKVRSGGLSINRAYEETKKPFYEKEVDDFMDVDDLPTIEDQQNKGQEIAQKLIREIKLQLYKVGPEVQNSAVFHLIEYLKGEYNE